MAPQWDFYNPDWRITSPSCTSPLKQVTESAPWLARHWLVQLKERVERDPLAGWPPHHGDAVAITVY
ncbi:MAG: hypothetical protein AB7K36_24255 [Chloroflexota bacterium]